jgi:hypothetical protein
LFVLTAAGTAASDFVSLSGAKLIAILVVVLLVVVLVTSIADRSAMFSRVRGVQPRQQFIPWVFGVVLIVVGLGAWLISRYGNGFVGDIADAVGLRNYPHTVAGILWGAAFTDRCRIRHGWRSCRCSTRWAGATSPSCATRCPSMVHATDQGRARFLGHAEALRAIVERTPRP